MLDHFQLLQSISDRLYGGEGVQKLLKPNLSTFYISYLRINKAVSKFPKVKFHVLANVAMSEVIPLKLKLRSLFVKTANNWVTRVGLP